MLTNWKLVVPIRISSRNNLVRKRSNNIYFSRTIQLQFESTANSSPSANRLCGFLRRIWIEQIEFYAPEIDKGIPLHNDRALDFILTPVSISYLGNTSLTIIQHFTYNEKSFFHPFTTTALHWHTRMHFTSAVKEIIGCPRTRITDVVPKEHHFTDSEMAI